MWAQGMRYRMWVPESKTCATHSGALDRKSQKRAWTRPCNKLDSGCRGKKLVNNDECRKEPCWVQARDKIQKASLHGASGSFCRATKRTGKSKAVRDSQA